MCSGEYLGIADEVTRYELAKQQSVLLLPDDWSVLDAQAYCTRSWHADTSGGQFVNVYGPTFYGLFGLTDLRFVYAAVGHGVGVVATFIGILLVDKIGRRPLIIFGATILVICNFFVGSVGARPNLSTHAVNGVVASMILILTSVKISFQANACEYTCLSPR